MALVDIPLASLLASSWTLNWGAPKDRDFPTPGRLESRA